MDDDEVSTYVSALEQDGFGEDFDEAPVECPACGHLARVSGIPDPGWEADWDTEGSHSPAFISGVYLESIHLSVTRLECRVCRLSLTGPLLGIAGLAAGLAVGLALILSNVPVVFSVRAMIGAFACAVVTGLVFGYAPARTASRLDPVRALAGE